jgi:hypothetical protein
MQRHRRVKGYFVSYQALMTGRRGIARLDTHGMKAAPDERPMELFRGSDTPARPPGLKGSSSSGG